MAISLSLSDVDALLRRMEQIGQVSERIKEEALLAGAEVLRAKIAEMAKRSPIVDKPHLAENIIISAIEDGKLDVGPHKSFFYGLYLELGTSKMDAQPFMQPAFDASRSQIEDAMKAVLRQGMGL